MKKPQGGEETKNIPLTDLHSDSKLMPVSKHLWLYQTTSTDYEKHHSIFGLPGKQLKSMPPKQKLSAGYNRFGRLVMQAAVFTSIQITEDSD